MPRIRGVSTEAQGRRGEIGVVWNVPETNVGNIGRQDRKALVAHRKGSNRGFRGF